MHINSLETKFKGGNERMPVPLVGESYYHRHQPVKFHVVIEGMEETSTQMYSATGKIHLTDKRLIFIAQEPCNNLETFHVMLEDIISSIKSQSRPRSFKKKKTFSERINLRNDIVFIISIRYKKKDLKEKMSFEDYYSMLVRSKIFRRNLNG
jgi:hypothetical protein